MSLVAFLVELGGILLLSAGLYLAWPPLSLIVGGALLIFLAQAIGPRRVANN